MTRLRRYRRLLFVVAPMALAMTAAETTTLVAQPTDVVVVKDFMFSEPSCVTGELVVLTGTLRHHFKITTDSSGGVHVNDYYAVNGRGYGEPTHASYVASDEQLQSTNFPGPTFVYQVVFNTKVIRMGETVPGIERKAPLAPTTGGEVMGEAEVEYATEMPAEQEVEFAARGLTPGSVYTLVVDGREVTTVTADPRGRIAIELNVPLPGALR